MRLPSDKAIHKRCLLAYHRAQALSRNEEYQGDIQRLQEMGLSFDGSDGWPSFPPTGELIVLSERIRRRAGLRHPMLPEKLRRLSLKEITEYAASPPVFVDIPGWDLQLKEGKKKEMLRHLRHNTFTSPRKIRDWFRYHPVLEKRLAKRHRGISPPYEVPPDDLYSQYWQVFDLRRQGRREREILATLWPEELARREAQRMRAARPGQRGMASSSEKDFLRQRIYNWEKTAKVLIRAAYPPLPSDR